MPIKSVKMKISKNKKMRFLLISQGSPRDFCAGIGPLQLGVVLVFNIGNKMADINAREFIKKWYSFL